MLRSRYPILLVIVLLAITFGKTTAIGAPAADLWPRWQAHDPASLTVVDHLDWNLILQRYLVSNHPSGINRFQYSKVAEKDRRTLAGYLEQMQAVEVSKLNRKEQMAFWINLYNALTVNVILEHYPVKSIRSINLSSLPFFKGPWNAKLAIIEGQEISLNDIEHRILRPIWQDNRVHYVLNCASLGCPNLQPFAFTSGNLEMLLEKAARDFINHERGVSFWGNMLNVSSIYFWYQDDFGGSEKRVIQHIRKYLTPETAKKLNTIEKKINHRYDWRLNE